MKITRDQRSFAIEFLPFFLALQSVLLFGGIWFTPLLYIAAATFIAVSVGLFTWIGTNYIEVNSNDRD